MAAAYCRLEKGWQDEVGSNHWVLVRWSYLRYVADRLERQNISHDRGPCFIKMSRAFGTHPATWPLTFKIDHDKQNTLVPSART